MAEHTKIQWTDHSWSPWRGCTKVSPGCANCYAETLSHRNPKVLGEWGKGKPRVKAKNWHEPLKWNRYLTCECGAVRVLVEDTRTAACPKCQSAYRRQRVFPSLCDPLDDEVHIHWLLDFLELMWRTPNLIWLLLTKRPEQFGRIQAVYQHMKELYLRGPGPSGGYTGPGLEFFAWMTKLVTEGADNIWWGVSVEDQQRADERIPILMDIPAKVRFLSLEPLLEPVFVAYTCFNGADSFGTLPGIDWMIIGGESGPKARPCNIEWIRELIRDGNTYGCPVFVKQLGSEPTYGADTPIPERFKDKKGGDPAEWPDDLRVRQFPER